MFMEMARVAAKRSTCHRLNVGAVLVHDKKVISIGYNGAPSGEPHCNSVDCAMSGQGCTRTIHAERNAIESVDWLTIKGAALYVTHSPCEACTQLILQHSIKEVYFETAYRKIDHLYQLTAQGIHLFQYTLAGYLINQSTGDIREA